MNKYVKHFPILLISGIVLLTGVDSVAQDKWQQALSLEGKWKFSIGDRPAWSERYYNDNQWESISVPSSWEEQGFNGYDGFAWYRRSFDGNILKNKDLAYSLFLGYIDDVDEVYLNGHKIGASGAFPPNYRTAYDAFRNYSIPKEFIDLRGRNVIAIKVYDAGIEGGIVSGDVGIYFNRSDEGLTVNLRGMWNFKVTGSRGYKNEMINEAAIAAVAASTTGWVDIMVPNYWERQGFASYDGSAWYRRKFVIPKELAGEELVLLMGKIDDSDRTYLNGKLVGSMENHFETFRTYPISPALFKAGEVNVLLIWVDDPQGDGGIYEGPVGLMKQADYTRYIRWRK